MPPVVFVPEEWPALMEVLRLWESRRILTPDQVAALARAARGRAVSLANVWETRFIGDVQDLISAMMRGEIEGGLSGAAFREAADKLVAKYGGGEALRLYSGERFSPWYATTVFRTNVTSAFAAARYAEMFSPRGHAMAGFWLYDAILDDRNDDDDKCPDMICRELNGTVFSKDDPDAAAWLPPLHYNCRCSAIELDETDVEDGGYRVSRGVTWANVFGRNRDIWSDDKVATLTTNEFLPGVWLPGGPPEPFELPARP